MPKFNNARQLPSGRWQGRYVGPDGKSHAKTFSTAREAADWVGSQKGDARSGEWVSPLDASVPFSEWFDRYTAARVDARASTLARDASYSDNHIVPEFGTRPIGDIAQPDVTSWVGRLVNEKGLAPSTVHAIYQVFNGAMSAAVDAKVIRTSPCFKVKLPTIEQEEMRFLTPKEIARLVVATPDRYKALVLVACYGGLRIGELAGLNREDYNPATRRLHVARNAVEVRGRLTLGSPKTKAGRRSVALPGAVAEAVAAHLRDFTGPGEDSPIFAGADGARLRANHFRARVWRDATEAAGLAGLRIHDMRHTAIALWIHAGAPVLQVSKQAGHSKVAFTLQRYGHLYDDAADTLTAGLDALMGDTLARAAGDGLAPVVPLRRAKSVPSTAT